MSRYPLGTESCMAKWVQLVCFFQWHLVWEWAFFCFYKLWGTYSEDIDDLYFLTEFCWARLEKFGWRLWQGLCIVKKSLTKLSPFWLNIVKKHVIIWPLGRVVDKNQQPVKYAIFSARFCWLLSLLQEPVQRWCLSGLNFGVNKNTNLHCLSFLKT